MNKNADNGHQEVLDRSSDEEVANADEVVEETVDDQIASSSDDAQSNVPAMVSLDDASEKASADKTDEDACVDVANTSADDANAGVDGGRSNQNKSDDAPTDESSDEAAEDAGEPSKDKAKRRKKGKHAASRFGKKARLAALSGASSHEDTSADGSFDNEEADTHESADPTETSEQPVDDADSAEVGEAAETTEVIETVDNANAVESFSNAAPEAPAAQAPATQVPVIQDEFGGISVKKKRRGLKVLGIIAASLVGLICVVYLVGVIVFMGRMYPNMQLGQFDISMQTNAEVAQDISDALQDYELTIKAAGFEYRLDGNDLGINVDTDSVARAVHARYEALKWPWYVIEGMQNGIDATDELVVTYDKSAFADDLKAAIDKYNETGTSPQNATITYDDKQKKFIVKKEVYGTQLDFDATMEAIDGAIRSLEKNLKLSQGQTIQPQIYSSDERLINSADLATGMTSAEITLIMAGQKARTVTGADLSPFVAIDENLSVTFSDEALDAWCEDLANSMNTAGAERTYTRADGKVITVSGGEYGWTIDKDTLKAALIDGIKSGQKIEIEVPLVDTAATYTGPGQRDWGARYIDVDISEQHVRFYNEAGELFWETDCITGSPDGSHDTVEGVWTVNSKESPSKLIGYENGKKIYESYVTYWMPFEGNSIGFHDATWQPGFGGSMYRNGYGSHGCVNLSYSAAQELYGIIEVGDVVVVHS